MAGMFLFFPLIRRNVNEQSFISATSGLKMATLAPFDTDRRGASTSLLAMRVLDP